MPIVNRRLSNLLKLGRQWGWASTRGLELQMGIGDALPIVPNFLLMKLGLGKQGWWGL